MRFPKEGSPIQLKLHASLYNSFETFIWLWQRNTVCFLTLFKHASLLFVIRMHFTILGNKAPPIKDIATGRRYANGWYVKCLR